MVKTIVTNLKFTKHSNSGKLVSFISKQNKSWRGVRENDNCSKIIVLPDVELTKKIQEGTLYRCKLVPMTNKLGYVAVNACALQFNANMEIVLLPKSFKINIHFGNQTIVYDHSSSDHRYNSFENISKKLEATHQIKNLGETIDDLRKNINITAAQYV